MKINKFFWVISLLTLLSISCNRKTIQQLQSSSERNFTYFIGKGKIRFTDEQGNKQSASLQLKMQKDSVVWGNVSKSVVQVARFSILNDSIFLLDKLTKKYIPRNINSLVQGISIKFTEPMMENLLLGNLILPLDDNTKIKKNKITQKADNYLITSTYDPSTKKILSVEITEPNTVNKIDITYSNYKQVETLVYPQKTVINGQILKEELIKNSVTIELKNVSTPSTKPSFPFKVPSSYEQL